MKEKISPHKLCKIFSQVFKHIVSSWNYWTLIQGTEKTLFVCVCTARRQAADGLPFLPCGRAFVLIQVLYRDITIFLGDSIAFNIYADPQMLILRVFWRMLLWIVFGVPFMPKELHQISVNLSVHHSFFRRFR